MNASTLLVYPTTFALRHSPFTLRRTVLLLRHRFASRMASATVDGMKIIGGSSFPDVSNEKMDFVQSSFFKIKGRQLPNPPSVDSQTRGIVIMPEMQLVIKYGPRVTIDEAVTMLMVKKVLGDLVPVPELFGWRVHQGAVFIYMELISGVTLQECWSSMELPDKHSICGQLCQMISSLRQVQYERSLIGQCKISIKTSFFRQIEYRICGWRTIT